MPKDVGELTARAQQIVLGDVVEVTSFWDHNHDLIKSRVVVRVQNYLLGEGTGIEVLEMSGGTVGDVTLRVSVLPVFEPGDRVLLFLGGHPTRLLGSFQGAYLTDGEMIARMAPGCHRIIDGSRSSLTDFLGQVAQALPGGGSLPDVIAEGSDFRLPLGDSRYAPCGYDWDYMPSPMGERYYVNANCTDSSAGTGASQVAEIQSAMAAWNNSGADFQFTYGGASTGAAVVRNDTNLIFFSVNPPDGGDYLAANYHWYVGDDMVESDIVFNDRDIVWWNGAGQCCQMSDIQSVAAHELGHTLCLRDLYDASDWAKTMFGYSGPCETHARTLHCDDINGIISIYGGSPAGTCGNGACEGGEDCVCCPQDCISCEPCPAFGFYTHLEHIGRVSVGSIDNQTGSCGYSDYSPLSTEAAIGTPYQITISIVNAYASDIGGLWADWNQDGDFTDGDETITTAWQGVGPYITTITPPAGATLGSARLRVRIQDGDPDHGDPVLSPCGGTAYGEVEDYTMMVMEGAGACCCASGCQETVASGCACDFQGPGTSCGGDADGDATADMCDVCPGFEDSNHPDCDDDGYEGEDGTGEDCDDFDANINPDASDPCPDGIDQNCDQVDGTLPDTDNDGTGDGCDTCTDADGDGWGRAGLDQSTCQNFGDDCDDTPGNTVDEDQDNVCDPDDNCPDTSNPGQEDADSDGVGDFCDTCTDADGDGWGVDVGNGIDCPQNGSTPDCNDTPGNTVDDDQDNVCDPDDNCPAGWNPGQEDCNNDGEGNVCEGGWDERDDDDDGWCNAVDVCPDDYDPEQEDADSDGLGDICDPCTDVDGDGWGVDLGNGIACQVGGAQEDCNDSDDAIHPSAPEACNDSVDNDCDGQTDCDDPDCSADPVCLCGNGSCELPEDQCICPEDCGTPPASEVPVSTCSDGIDNDCDGETDCDDPDCADDPDCMLGACCLAAGCQDVTSVDCASLGGVFMGLGTECGQDYDGDDIVDGCDNCPATSNPEQTNSDTDSLGDACDNCRFVDNDDQTDTDDDSPGCDFQNDFSCGGDACDQCTDADGDHYGVDLGNGIGCLFGGGLEDCDDSNRNIHPGADDPCDGTDQNCNGADGRLIDIDGDGLGNDCDGDDDGDCVVDDDDDSPALCHMCEDVDNDTCDDCGRASYPDCYDPVCDNDPADDGPDQDGDDLCDGGDPCTDADGDGWGRYLFDRSECAQGTAVDCNDHADNTVDDDHDNVCGADDNCPADYNPQQEDEDSDLIGDACDNCPLDQNPDQVDTDDDGMGDVCDTCTDADDDGWGVDVGNGIGCPNGSTPDCDDEGTNAADPDVDNVCHPNDNCPDTANPDQADADGDAEGDVCDTCTDSDGDLYGDPGFPANICPEDGCPDDGNKHEAGPCGCGVPDDDGDGDQTPDCHDSCPTDPAKADPGVCGCGVSDGDKDADGTVDCDDGCPDDAGKTAAGLCGCGLADGDTDGDAVLDCLDNCAGVPNADQADSDGDGVGDACLDTGQPIPPCGCGAGSAGLMALWALLAARLRRRRAGRR